MKELNVQNLIILRTCLKYFQLISDDISDEVLDTSIKVDEIYNSEKQKKLGCLDNFEAKSKAEKIYERLEVSSEEYFKSLYEEYLHYKDFFDEQVS